MTRHRLSLCLLDGPAGAEQAAALQRAASDAGRPLAAWLRSVALAAAGRADLDREPTPLLERAAAGGRARRGRHRIRALHDH